MIHYIWLNYTSSTGSCKSELVYNGLLPDALAIETIDNCIKYNLNELLKNAPNWLKDITNIRLSAQNIITHKVIYEREINL